MALFGLRPEHITEHAANGAAQGQMVEAAVELIEPLGSETFLYAEKSRHSFVARIGAERRFKPRQAVPLAFDMSRAHFFDAATEQAI